MVYELYWYLNKAVYIHILPIHLWDIDIYQESDHFLHLHCYYPGPSHHHLSPEPLQHSGQRDSVTMSSRLGDSSAQSPARAPISWWKPHSFFLYFCLHWVFVAACALSLAAASRGYSSLRCVGFSLWWLLLLQSTGSRHMGFSSCGSRALERRLSSCGALA